MMLDIEIPTDKLTEDQLEIVETATEVLYGLIHARYILTTKGMARMHEKFVSVDFGRCPRVHCQGQGVLPIGLSDIPRNYSVNTFCPKCRDIFYPKSVRQANLDGSYFGTTFAHLFLLIYTDCIPSPAQQVYTPRVFGFKIHNSSTYWSNRDGYTEASKRGSDRLNISPAKAGASGAALPPPPSASQLSSLNGGADSMPAPPSVGKY